MQVAYELFDPKVDEKLSDVSREEAQKAFDWFIEDIPNRIKELSKLAEQDSILLDFSDESISQLSGWFYNIVAYARAKGQDKPSAEIFSVSHDIGIYISESIVRFSDNITWKLFIADKNGLSYQRPVITGFNVKNKNYHIDFDYLICQYAFRILKTGKEELNLLESMYKKTLTRV